jgi:hypothetical protein
MCLEPSPGIGLEENEEVDVLLMKMILSRSGIIKAIVVVRIQGIATILS